MQVIVAAPQDGVRARLADALRAVALPGIAVVGAEPAGAGTGSLGAVALFQWGPVLLDAADWPALEEQARTLSEALSSGGLQVLPPCIVRVLEPGDLPSATPEAASAAPTQEPMSPAYGTAPVRAAHRAAALSPEHLSEVIIDLARERYGMQQWSTADALWTMDRLRLPRQAIDAISDESLVTLGFVSSRVPLLDGKPRPAPPASAAQPPAAAAPAGAPAGAPPIGAPPVPVPPPIGAPPVSAPPPVPAEAPPLAPAPFPASELVVPPEAPTTMIAAVPDAVAASAAAPPSAAPARLSGYSVLDDRDDDAPPRRFPLWPIFAALAALVVIVCVVIFFSLGGGSSNDGASGGDSGSATPPTTSAPPPSPAPSTPAPLPVPAGYSAAAFDSQTDCAGHSYGQVAAFFQGTPCVLVQRQLLTATTGGHPTVYAVREVTMPSPAAAASFKALVDGSGTGNVNDQLREGATYPGGPTRLPSNTAYASAINGNQVRVVEAAPTDGTSVDDVPAVQAAVNALAATW